MSEERLLVRQRATLANEEFCEACGRHCLHGCVSTQHMLLRIVIILHV